MIQDAGVWAELTLSDIEGRGVFIVPLGPTEMQVRGTFRLVQIKVHSASRDGKFGLVYDGAGLSEIRVLNDGAE